MRGRRSIKHTAKTTPNWASVSSYRRKKDGREKQKQTPLWLYQMKSGKQRWHLVLVSRIFLESLVLSFQEQWGYADVHTHSHLQAGGKRGQLHACEQGLSQQQVWMRPLDLKGMVEHQPTTDESLHPVERKRCSSAPQHCSLPFCPFLMQTSTGFSWTHSFNPVSVIIALTRDTAANLQLLYRVKSIFIKQEINRSLLSFSNLLDAE